MPELHAEIEQTKRVLVVVDIEKHCAAYPAERAEFDGSDEEFAREGIKEMQWELLNDMDTSDRDDGITVTPDYDETEVSFNGIVPS